jgi:hypothetical protein
MTFQALAPQDWFKFLSDSELGARRGRSPFQKIGYNGAYMDRDGGYWALKGRVMVVLVMKVEAP